MESASVLRRHPWLQLPSGGLRGVGRRQRWDAVHSLRQLTGGVDLQGRDERLIRLTHQIWRGRRQWLDSASRVDYLPKSDAVIPEVALIGRRMVGKTTLLSRTVGERHVRGGAKDAEVMNFYSVNDCIRVIDTPGMGWARAGAGEQARWQNAVVAMVHRRPQLRRLYLLADLRVKGFTERDRSMLECLLHLRAPVTLVVSMADKFCRESEFRGQTTDTEESQERLLHEIHKLRESLEVGGARELPVMVLAALRSQGVAEWMYDVVANCYSHLPSRRLELELVRGDLRIARGERKGALGAPPASAGVLMPSESDLAVLSECKYLPPMDCPEGVLRDPTLGTDRKFPPVGDRGAVAMMGEEEEAEMVNVHPLHGTEVLRKYFPALADDWLRRNHAGLNPTAKVEAERYFGLRLPGGLREKYMTPDEREARRRRELERLKQG
eukprot:Hpha_TRINITY_DN16018_c3_g6::TRINITY_DN16018_c3_g6_i1::g.118210::m.118210